jgi:WD40 repeat protein
MVHRYRCGIWVWDSATAVLKHTVSLEKNDTASAFLGFTPDGKMFAMARKTMKGWSIPTAVEVRDCETGELKSKLTDNKWDDWPQYVFWSDDGRTFVATSGHKYKGRIWDVTTGRLKATIPMLLTFSRIPFDFGFKDRDELSIHPTLPIVSAVSSRFVRLWNAGTGELMQRLENTGRMAEWSTDGKLLLTSTEDRTSVFIWDVHLSALGSGAVALPPAHPTDLQRECIAATPSLCS